ncbi:hypothetical protein ACFWBI_35020 [Streptomyces sp. NPDC059982]
MYETPRPAPHQPVHLAVTDGDLITAGPTEPVALAAALAAEAEAGHA